ncbi:hypothetical protein FPV67DRAFT_887925 [Lyophyllum atratum]|nr:hypothetical protein FPV67DRAFT_887925 [Lyophyllum atratum]
MSLLARSSSTTLVQEPRKRTSSFSYPHQQDAFSPSPRPHKAPRLAVEMGATLRRTESYVTLSDIRPVSTTARRTGLSDQPMSLLPYHRTLQYYKDQRDRERRRAQMNRAGEPLTIRVRADPAQPPTVRHHAPQPPKPCSPSPTTPAKPLPRCAVPTINTPPRHTSPLAPTRGILPGRPLFPRSKAEPDLYRKALKTAMKGTPEGQKILRMGPRLAVSIMTATKELERIVAAAQEGEPQDIVMADATGAATTAVASSAPVLLTKSWVVVPGEDWEMVECGA